MTTLQPCLAVVPARGGSKGLPGKNIKPFAGMPLIGHSLRLARMCPEIAEVVVSTDAPEIAAAARALGHEPPFLRPPDLARDETPMWPVLRHALEEMESRTGKRYASIILLDPTSPSRLPEDVAEAMRRLEHNPSADGIVAVSQPDFNPSWVCVVERDGRMAPAFPHGERIERRQDAPIVYRINGLLYAWRASFVKREPADWRNGRMLMLKVPEARALSIDSLNEFQRAEVLVREGLIRLPWLAPP